MKKCRPFGIQLLSQHTRRGGDSLQILRTNARQARRSGTTELAGYPYGLAPRKTCENPVMRAPSDQSPLVTFSANGNLRGLLRRSAYNFSFNAGRSGTLQGIGSSGSPPRQAYENGRFNILLRRYPIRNGIGRGPNPVADSIYDVTLRPPVGLGRRTEYHPTDAYIALDGVGFDRSSGP